MTSEYMTKMTPEEAGISSGNVKKFLEVLNEYRVNLHSLLLAKGDQIFTEVYWEPFHENYFHRIYSDTKSYVGVAVTQLACEGKISLEDYWKISQPNCCVSTAELKDGELTLTESGKLYYEQKKKAGRKFV